MNLVARLFLVNHWLELGPDRILDPDPDHGLVAILDAEMEETVQTTLGGTTNSIEIAGKHNSFRFLFVLLSFYFLIIIFGLCVETLSVLSQNEVKLPETEEPLIAHHLPRG